MLEIKIRKQLAAFSLRLDLALEPAFTALFGPSGSGKTTTLNLLAGLLTPDDGEIALDGRLLFSKEKKINLKPRARNLGYIFQESRLFPHLSVQQNLQFGLRRPSEHSRAFDFDEIVAVAGLAPLLPRMPGDLSGGEKQRAALARAILAAPDYLLMDEPLAALDQPVRLALLEFLKEVHERLALPILYVTHDLSNVINFADQVVVLKAGTQVGVGPPLALLDKMSAPPLVSREDIANIFQAEITAHDAAKGVTRVQAKGLELILPRLHAAVGENVLLNLPASEIILSVIQPQGLSASNIFRGQITAIHHIGERVFVAIAAGETFTVEIVQATVKRLALAVGKEVFLIFKASSFRRLG
ncbi:MAG: molybdenum ABC transporter ATP-binding protein [bacterium]